MTIIELVQAVKDHALDHYEHDGWDYIVESFSDDEIAGELEGINNVDDAIETVGALAKLLADVRADVQAEIF